MSRNRPLVYYLDQKSSSTLSLFLLVTIAFLTGHSVARYVRSLAPLTPLTRSAALRFATLASLARSVHGLAHSLRSLPRGTVEIHESVFMLRSRSKETNAIVVITRNTPSVSQLSKIIVVQLNPAPTDPLLTEFRL